VHPTLLHIGHLTLPTFGVLAACGLMLALALSQRTAPLAGLSPDALWDGGLFAILAAFVLSRLLLVVTYFSSFKAYPILLLAVPSLTPTGLLLSAIATFLWLHFKRIPLVRTLDAWAPCATLVWAFLALGHYAEGSDPGMQMRSHTAATYPVALYVASAAAALTLAAYAHLKSRRSHTAALTLIASGLLQFCLSFIRQPGFAGPLDLDRLQWLSIGMILAGFVLLPTPSSRLKTPKSM
jgi:phosphatidylglycerol:prolipoprotein diacylglycerol transferase